MRYMEVSLAYMPHNIHHTQALQTKNLNISYFLHMKVYWTFKEVKHGHFTKLTLDNMNFFVQIHDSFAF